MGVRSPVWLAPGLRWDLLRGRLSRPTQSARPVDDAVPVRVPDRLDQVPPFRAVAALRLRRLTRRQMPFNAVSFPAGGNLAPRAYDRPPVDARQGSWRRGRLGFRL